MHKVNSFNAQPAAVTNNFSISAELASFFWWCWIPATTRDFQLDFKKSNNSFKHQSWLIWPMDSISHMHWSSRWRSQGQDFYHGIPVKPGGLLAIEPRGARYQLSLSFSLPSTHLVKDWTASDWMQLKLGWSFKFGPERNSPVLLILSMPKWLTGQTMVALCNLLKPMNTRTKAPVRHRLCVSVQQRTGRKGIGLPESWGEREWLPQNCKPTCDNISQCWNWCLDVMVYYLGKLHKNWFSPRRCRRIENHLPSPQSPANIGWECFNMSSCVNVNSQLSSKR